MGDSALTHVRLTEDSQTRAIRNGPHSPHSLASVLVVAITQTWDFAFKLATQDDGTFGSYRTATQPSCNANPIERIAGSEFFFQVLSRSSCTFFSAVSPTSVRLGTKPMRDAPQKSVGLSRIMSTTICPEAVRNLPSKTSGDAPLSTEYRRSNSSGEAGMEVFEAVNHGSITVSPGF